ncbi:MAG: S-layer homology domain-containing protein, partial [Candidatus Gracilibacteria bacterium]|nr:S-layer homology domain-containing protein [Candidatus Gracilibacteria bacterium]
EQGIVKGYADGSFKPSSNVLMVEGLKMALETFDLPLTPIKTGQHWFQPYVDFAHENNIFSKYSYIPGRNMSRGELAYLVHQLLLNEKSMKQFTGIRNNHSAGCGKTPPNPIPTSSLINGIQQTYITDIPSGYNQNTPLSLTFGWHGRTNSNATVRSYYKVYQEAKGQTIMVYPAGTGGWNLNRDVAIFDQLLAEFSENYCIDTDRVFIVGHSLGSWFTNSLACLRGDVIRASGSLGGGTSAIGCSGPVAAITMHNPADQLSPFTDGIKARDVHLAQNDCTMANIPYPGPDKSNCILYTECSPENPVVWCAHTEDYSWGDYYPHGWPKWTGSEIWKFFETLN